MAFNISEFNAAINSGNGLLYSSHFLVMITAPKWSQGQSEIIQSIPMYCDGTELPGMNFEIDPIRPSGYGLFDSRPIFSNFAPINLSFYCDGNGQLLKFFQSWMQNIQNFNVNQRQSSSVNGAALGVFNYPDWYETTIEIFQFNAVGEVVCKWSLDRAYPLTLSNTQVAWDQADQLLKLQVQFSYRAWTTEAIGQGSSAGADPTTYSLSRVDPGIAQGINRSFMSASGFGNIINNVLANSFYAPLASGPSTIPNVDNQNPYNNIVNERPVPLGGPTIVPPLVTF